MFFVENLLHFRDLTPIKMQLIDGKSVASQLKIEIGAEVAALVAKGYRAPYLAAILVGNNPASEAYVKNKVKSCEAVGFRSLLVRMEATVQEADLLAEIDRLNHDPEIDGFIVQLPLPGHIDEKRVTLAIDPDKDVDGFHPANLGKMVLGLPCFLPATPMGILELLKRYKIETVGKHCVVVGRSHIVGAPMSILMGQKAYPGNCTVTLVHSKTHDLAAEIRRADIVVAAIGQAEMITADMVKEGAVVIDVGINRVEDPSQPKGYRLVGDVKFDEVAPKSSFITPVPGGVGPLTVMSLIRNTLQSAKIRQGIQ
jgi:methylenetetrahydrofolate dehydrogenase (NADP+)/methenyltetrahydrofolate cyclohydrolase